MTPFPFERQFLGGSPLILASGSPRRAELLRLVGAPFTVIVPPAESAPGDGTPGEVVELLAREKASAVAAGHPASWVLGADTLVYLDGMALGKPRDRAEAAAMLGRLSGRSHEVWTGICLCREGGVHQASVRSKVTFLALTASDINLYIDTDEPMDKAGAYGIQGFGALWIAEIEGCYFNVMGLPLSRLGQLFHEARKISIRS